MQRSLTILNIVLIVGAVYLGVSAFSKITAKNQDQPDLSDSVPEKASPLETEIRQPMSYYRVINSRNLFNIKPAAEVKDKSIDIGALKKTDLRLKLWGTVTGDKDGAYAVIEETGTRQQNLYRVGDTVQQATVRAAVAVESHGIMVEVHHQPEKALSDGAQSLYPEQFKKLNKQIRIIHEELQNGKN